MTTAAVSRHSVAPMPGRRYDSFFFSAMALIMLGLVLVGFARSYFLAGIFRAPLPSLIVHIHGALFSAWALLFVAQTSLVASGNVRVHRKVGLWAFGLSICLVVLGVMAATDALRRGVAPLGLDAQTFYAIPMSGMLQFAVLLYFGYRERLNSPAHKRLLTLAMICLIGAPTARPPLNAITGHHHLQFVFAWALIALMLLYDLWALHKVHIATLWGGLFVVILSEMAVPIGFTRPWHMMAQFLQTFGR